MAGRKRIDESGNKYGNLVVLNSCSIRKKAVKWDCICACGTKIAVDGGSLRSGQSTSCGCISRRKTVERQLIDLQGKRFGQWEVLHYSGVKKGQTYWTCECSCGIRDEVNSFSLMHGRSLSCRHCGARKNGHMKRGENNPNWVKDRVLLKKNKKVSSFMRSCLRRMVYNKSGRKTKELLGYSREKLIKRLEFQFEESMNWDNYGNGDGKWNIDHIKPIVVFLDEGIFDPTVVNALSNLQPLWWRDNLKKSRK